MKLFIKIFLQWTWGILQNIAGLAVFLVNAGRPHRIYRGNVVTDWKSEDASMGLGMFIFMGRTDSGDEEILAHEYGHTVQSMILGPFYLPVIGLPSLVWANFKPLIKRRRSENISYYSFYPERWANKIAMKRVGRAPGTQNGEIHINHICDNEIVKKV